MAKLSFLNKDTWTLRSEYSEKEKTKSLIYAEWNKKAKVWKVVPSIHAYQEIKNSFKDTVTIDPEIEKYVDNHVHLYELLNQIKRGELKLEYDFGKTNPYDHQKICFDFASVTDGSALFLDAGTGKTFIMIHAINNRIKKGLIKKALIVCPLSIIELAWMTDVATFSDLKAVSLHDKIAKKRKELFKQEADIYIINFEAVSGYYKEIEAMGFDMICIDESSKCKSNTTSISKSLIKLSKNIKYRIIASGTPAPNSPLELWSQMMIIDGGATLGTNFYKFRERFGSSYGYGGYQWSVNDANKEEINRIIYSTNAIRYKKDDCLDLPSKTFINRCVELTDDQWKAYNDMAENMLAEVGDVVVTANIAATQLIRFQQITSGFVKSSEGEEVPFDINPKMIELKALVEEINPNDNKIIIWARFKRDIRGILEEFKHLNPVDIYGETEDRNENIRRFKTDPSTRIMVANPAAAGHGLTLVESSYAIYYSMDYSLENYLQSQDRIHRIGQNKNVTYYHMIATDTVDQAVIRSLSKKGDAMESLLKSRIVDIIKGNVNGDSNEKI